MKRDQPNFFKDIYCRFDIFKDETLNLNWLLSRGSFSLALSRWLSLSFSLATLELGWQRGKEVARDRDGKLSMSRDRQSAERLSPF